MSIARAVASIRAVSSGGICGAVHRLLSVRNSVGSSFQVPLSVKSTEGTPFLVPRQARASNGTVINLI